MDTNLYFQHCSIFCLVLSSSTSFISEVMFENLHTIEKKKGELSRQPSIHRFSEPVPLMRVADMLEPIYQQSSAVSGVYPDRVANHRAICEIATIYFFSRLHIFKSFITSPHSNDLLYNIHFLYLKIRLLYRSCHQL